MWVLEKRYVLLLTSRLFYIYPAVMLKCLIKENGPQLTFLVILQTATNLNLVRFYEGGAHFLFFFLVCVPQNFKVVLTNTVSWPETP